MYKNPTASKMWKHYFRKDFLDEVPLKKKKSCWETLFWRYNILICRSTPNSGTAASNYALFSRQSCWLYQAPRILGNNKLIIKCSWLLLKRETKFRFIFISSYYESYVSKFMAYIRVHLQYVPVQSFWTSSYCPLIESFHHSNEMRLNDPLKHLYTIRCPTTEKLFSDTDF